MSRIMMPKPKLELKVEVIILPFTNILMMTSTTPISPGYGYR